jgi:hypothetical protein
MSAMPTDKTVAPPPPPEHPAVLPQVVAGDAPPPPPEHTPMDETTFQSAPAPTQVAPTHTVVPVSVSLPATAVSHSSFKDSPQSKGKPRIKHVKLRFTPDQYDVLDAVYSETQRPSDERCAQLADQMVRLFFQIRLCPCRSLPVALLVG